VGRDQGCPALHPPPVDDTEDVAFRHLVDLGRGLVGDEERRVGCERHRERPRASSPPDNVPGSAVARSFRPTDSSSSSTQSPSLRPASRACSLTLSARFK